MDMNEELDLNLPEDVDCENEPKEKATKKEKGRRVAIEINSYIQLVVDEDNKSISFMRKSKNDTDWWHDGWFSTLENCFKYAYDVMVKEKLLQKDQNSLLDLRNIILETKKEIQSYFEIHLKGY